MTGALLLVALAVLAAAALLDMSLGTVTRQAPLGTVSRRAAAPAHLLCAAAAVVMTIAGLRGALGHPGSVDVGNWLALGPAHLRIDPLAGLFLAVVGAVAFPVALGFVGWLTGPRVSVRRGLGALHAMTLGAVVVVVVSDNVFAFLFGWEALTLAFYLLAGFHRQLTDPARASVLTFAVSKVGGAALLLGFLLLAARSDSMLIQSWHTVPGGTARAAAYALLLVGFFAKVGVVPLQIWMPRGYAAAPGPARALMAGVATLAGFYGLWRTLDELGAPPRWLAIAVLIVAAVTALLGIAHATVQQDLRRVVAYSSVENGGLIVTGYGVALTGAALHNPRLIAVGLVAATLQMVAHAVAKSALFLAVSNIEAATGSTELDDLSGIGRDLPWTGAAFAAGALTLAGLPPTAGFVSEWFILESLMQQFRVADLAIRLTLAFAGALIALTAGFAAVAFVRILGLSIAGAHHPHGDRRTSHRETGVAGRAGLALLGVGCVALAVLAPLEIRLFAHGLEPVVGHDVTGLTLASPWVLGPVFRDFSVLSPTWLAIELPALSALVAVAAVLASGGRLLKVRRVPAWRSATGGVQGRSRYTAFGYANPTRRVLAGVLSTRSSLRELAFEEDRAAAPGDAPLPGVEVEPDRGSTDDSGAGKDGVEPGDRARKAARLGYSADVVEVIEQFLYAPLRSPVAAVVRTAKRLQSGRLEAYLAYMLIALVGVLTVVLATR